MTPLTAEVITREYSILMAVHVSDAVDDFRAAMQSIALQTLVPVQIVLVKDGALNAALEEVIACYVDILPLQLVSLEINKGLGVALNIGLKYCKCSLVGRADSDDINIPSRFETQVDYLNTNKDVDVVGSNLIELFEPQPRLKTVPQNVQLVYKTFFRNPVNHQTVMFRKETVLAVGSYEDCRNFEDYLLWCKLLKHGAKIVNISEPLVQANIDNLINKRSGHGYAVKEKYFYRRLMSMFPRYAPIILVTSSIRLAIRYMPTQFFEKFYGYLRTAKTEPSKRDNE